MRRIRRHCDVLCSYAVSYPPYKNASRAHLEYSTLTQAQHAQKRCVLLSYLRILYIYIFSLTYMISIDLCLVCSTFIWTTSICAHLVSSAFDQQSQHPPKAKKFAGFRDTEHCQYMHKQGAVCAIASQPIVHPYAPSGTCMYLCKHAHEKSRIFMNFHDFPCFCAHFENEGENKRHNHVDALCMHKCM
jgi:hypothetical protein